MENKKELSSLHKDVKFFDKLWGWERDLEMADLSGRFSMTLKRLRTGEPASRVDDFVARDLGSGVASKPVVP
jgi:hypothetical protein